jgi:hypothetical protein
LVDFLTNPKVAEFLHEHENDDVRSLVLRYKDIDGVPISILADHIAGKQKAKLKFPSLFLNEAIVFPRGVNVEQSSSELTANFKTEFVRSLGKQRFSLGADLTGGFGVDTFFLSKNFSRFHYVEQDQYVFEIAKANLEKLTENIMFHQKDAATFLSALTEKLDLVFIDPSRRDKANRKIVKLEECEPNILALQERVFEHTDRLLIKASPLYDIKKGISELRFVQSVIVLAVSNECRELLFYCEKNFSGEPKIVAINLDKVVDEFSFTFQEEVESQIATAGVSEFLYEPNAAIRKAGAFRLSGSRLGLQKLHVNTHLFTSDSASLSFPGRIFKVLALVKPNASDIRRYFPNGQANVVSRNYPQSADELKKKVKLKDGGERYLIGFTGIDGPVLVAADRIK